jgi:predicted SprT family Zn-dependent metalloprotease
MDAQMLMQQMQAIGLARVQGQRKAFWRMCMCGTQFHAIGRKRKVRRREAEEHIQRCRQKALQVVAES